MQSQDTELTNESLRNVRTILFVDVVEFVRLSEEDEEDAARRLEQVVDRIEKDVLPAHAGRFVHGSGDGVMLEFSETRSAVCAAFAIQRAFHVLNEGVAPSPDP